MGRNLGLGLAASSAAVVAIAASAPTAMGIDGVSAPLPVAAPVHVQAPSVPATPALPAVPSAPALPAAPSVSHPAPAAPRVPPPPPPPPLPVVTAVVAASERSRVPVAGGGRSSGGPTTTAAASAAPAGRSGSARRRVRAQGIAETARLRAEVKRLRGCLGVLPELDRHLIQMRAGIDGPALTRRAAAKELSISVTRAHRIERRGLRAMRSASRQGRCGTRPKASHAVQTFRLAAPARGTPTLAPAASFTPAPAAAPAPPAHAKQKPRQAVLGTQESSPPAQRPLGSRGIAASAPTRGHGLVIALVVLLLAANLLAGGVWLLRKRAARGGYGYVGEPREPRTYDAPDRSLDFGPRQDETPERPSGAEETARSEPPRGGF